MPNLDGTGPNGEGARTGRGLGNCKGDMSGRGSGRGMGRGYVRRYGKCFADMTKEERKDALLKDKAEIEKQLAELD